MPSKSEKALQILREDRGDSKITEVRASRKEARLIQTHNRDKGKRMIQEQTKPTIRSKPLTLSNQL